MKILVFGKAGQVGLELQARAGEIDVESLDRDVADLEDGDACATFVRETDADAIIIAAAYTAVDGAEDDEECALRVNSTGPGAIAHAAAARGLPLVHISTDYVFDGAGTTPFKTDDPIAPLGAYGRTKEAGERAVRDAGGTHAILRTSWVFSPHGNNFVKTMMRLGADRDELNIVGDQIGGPTSATDIAEACLTIAQQLVQDPSKTGTYHYSGGPDVSWADFARAIFARAGIACRVNDIPTSEYPTPAVRPLNSRMDNSKTAQTFGIARPDWGRALDTQIGSRNA